MSTAFGGVLNGHAMTAASEGLLRKLAGIIELRPTLL
jgi:hypothetical protein